MSGVSNDGAAGAGVTDAEATVRGAAGGAGGGPTGPGATSDAAPRAAVTRTDPNIARINEPERRVLRAEVTEEPVDVAALRDLVTDDEAGAVVTFCGMVRNHHGGQEVTGIDYSAHPDANKVMADIARDIAQRFPLDAIAVVHRIGKLGVGDVAMGAAVSGAHRQEAFAACAEIVEEVKKRLPIWKKQTFPDGAHEWTGSA